MSRPRGGSFLTLLLNAAEHGWLPDSVIRYGIRRLLKSRLNDLETNHEVDATTRFIDRTLTEQIAVQSVTANEQHYEVPAKFFQQALGPRLKYSSCYWPEGVDSLETAENAALRVTCENTELEYGMKILELGCGSLSLWMAPQVSIESDYFRLQFQFSASVNRGTRCRAWTVQSYRRYVRHERLFNRRII